MQITIFLTAGRKADGYFATAEYTVAGCVIVGVAINGLMAQKQFEIRNRLEKFFNKHGYDEHALTATTDHYCSRQAAMVACENYGYEERYAALCADNLEFAKLTWLPPV